MFRKVLVFVLVLISFNIRAFAAVFVVTSNADSGPGTLRDALAQAAANGSAVKDYINFNLPDLSAAGRTIIITDLLPEISSNLVIDGTTQPGNNFGVSEAKVKILLSFYSSVPLLSCLSINRQESVEIYGLCLDRDLAFFGQYNNQVFGIYSSYSKNIIIGAPGKGNIIKNFDVNIQFNAGDYYIDTIGLAQNIKVSSNFIGIDEDGVSVCKLGTSLVYFYAIKNLTFGGATAKDGNVVYGLTSLIKSSDNIHVNLGSALISNNLIGIDYSGENAFLNNPANYESSIDIADYTAGLKNCEISNNVILGGMTLFMNCFFIVKGNKIGTDITGTKIIPHGSLGIGVGYCTGGGKIGGTADADKNIFAGCFQNVPYDKKAFGVIDNTESPAVEVVGNVFRCNNGFLSYLLTINDLTRYVTITNRNKTIVEGTANPNSRVDLYYNLECSFCEPQQLFTSVITDANGKWSYQGTLADHAIIAAATSGGQTTEFTSLQFINDPKNIKIKPACNNQGGSITGIDFADATGYAWYDSSGKVVSKSKDLINQPAGKYHLLIDNGYCSLSSDTLEIKDASDQIDTTNKKVTPASCGLSNGSVTGLQADPSSSFSWTDHSGKIIGTGIDLVKAAPGSYTLTLTTADGSCSQVYGPVTIKNTSGPNIDQSKANIQSTNCGQSTGAITGIMATGSGTLKYAWWNNQQQTVSTAIDLLNQPAGTYKLEVTDDSQCGPVYTSDLIIPETNGITMDESKAQPGAARCGNNNGSVTGITVSGATQYQWTDANNKVVGTAVDLQNVAPGTYTLTASNSFGCTAASNAYVVAQLSPTKFPAYSATIVPACFQTTEGSVTVATDGLVKSLRWVQNGQTVGTDAALGNVGAGSYQLYLTDQNGCENYYNTYTVTEVPDIILSNPGTVTNDQCNLSAGSISGPEVEGGVPPYVYTWYNAANQQIGAGASISNLAAGRYVLNVTSARCGQLNTTYTVGNDDSEVPAPPVSNVTLCSAGSALISVNSPSAATVYRLYNNQSDTQPAAEQKGGLFTVNVTGNTSYYISEISGSCESRRAEVKVTVGLSALNIANTFTPNGDGINDYWAINGIANYPAAEVQVFTRNGQRVFYSKGYPTPFDGKKLPEGVYYYIINLHSNCSLLSGSLTIIR